VRGPLSKDYGSPSGTLGTRCAAGTSLALMRCALPQCSAATCHIRQAAQEATVVVPEIDLYRFIAWVNCPYRVADKASALRAAKRAPG